MIDFTIYSLSVLEIYLQVSIMEAVCTYRMLGEVVFRFLIGDGNKDRVHRKHLFNPKHKFVGIAIEGHASDFKSIVVVNFTPNFYDN